MIPPDMQWESDALPPFDYSELRSKAVPVDDFVQLSFGSGGLFRWVAQSYEGD